MHGLFFKVKPLGHKIQKAAMVSAIMFLTVNIIGNLSEIPSIHAQQSTENIGVGGVYPPNSTPYGLTYGEWTAKWWQWVYSMPETVNPTFDNTGVKCANNQTGPVWFLAGTFGGAVTRQCTIPSDKAILMPIINVECDSSSDPTQDTEAELRACAKADQDTVIGKEITVDGISIDNLDNYRFQSPLFNLTFPENNIAGVTPQTAKAVSDGFWILLEPLSPGMHEIHSKGVLGDPTATGTVNFALDVKYLLTVVEGQAGIPPTESFGNQSASN
jgi:hypothetical protein